MHAQFLWQTVSVLLLLFVGGFLLYYHITGRGTHRERGPIVDEHGVRIRVPYTKLQVRAIWALIIGTVTLLLILSVFSTTSVESYYQNDAIRIRVYLFALGGAAAYLIVHFITGLRYRREQRDERDLKVLHWAPTVQVTGMTLTLAVWAIGLTESYWSVGQVPIAYPILIFLSTIIVGGLFNALGVLLGYRRF